MGSRPLTFVLFAILAICLWYPVVAVRWQKRIEHRLHDPVAVNIGGLRVQLETYKSRNETYPTTQQGLAALGTVPKDSWNNNYVYRFPGMRNRSGYDLFSCGADAKCDTPDDDWGN
jgi:hypothetical protein